MADAIGITRVANVTGLDHVGVPTWMVIRPLAKSITVSQGKGLSDELAVVSGLMESIELYHAENVTPVGRLSGITSFAEDPSFVSPEQLQTRIDVALDDRQVVYWVRGRDLFTGSTKWIPRDLLDLDTTTFRPVPSLFVRSSNGLASGNTLREATLHGLCEVIERDQLAFWLVTGQLDRQPSPSRVDSATIDDPDCRWLLERCAKAGLEALVAYATFNIELPVFHCVVADEKRSTLYPQRASGSGCHPVKQIALSRAITEALQSRLTYISGTRDDVSWNVYRDSCHNAASNWLARLRSQPGLDYRQLPSAPIDVSVQTLLTYSLGRLAEAGLNEAIVVDLTREEYGIPVVFVCVPDLEAGIREPGHRPGRRLSEFIEANGFV